MIAEIQLDLVEVRVRIFFVILGFFLVIFTKTGTLDCDRIGKKADYCRVIQRGFLWSQEKEFPVNNLKGAKVITRGNKDSLSYKVVLIADDGEIPFSPETSFSNKKEQQELSQKINIFARNNQQKSLNISQNDKWWLVIGFISLVIGFYPSLKGIGKFKK
jgi:hypothetical protein